MNNSKTQYLLNLPFKGERTYLHSTDIFPALLNITGPIENLSIQFHKLTSKRLKAQFIHASDVEQLRRSKDICILMIFSRLGSQELIAVNETTEPVIDREPYKEELVTYGSTIKGKEISQNNPKSGSFIHRAVGLNKKLLNSIVGKHSWLITQLDLKKAPVEPDELTLRLERVIGNLIYQSVIVGNGKVLGKIIFSKL